MGLSGSASLRRSLIRSYALVASIAALAIPLLASIPLVMLLTATDADGWELAAYMTSWLLVAAAISIALAVTVGWWIGRGLTRHIGVMAEASRRVAAGDLTVRVPLPRAGELRAMSQAFNEMAERTERLVGTLRRFVADAAHGLHTPLTALKIDLESVLGEADLQRINELGARSLAQAQRLQVLVDALLDLSRLDAVPVDRRAALDLRALLAGLSEAAASQAEHRGVTYSPQLPTDPLPVRADPSQLRGAIRNLLDNAIKFTLPGGAVALQAEAMDGYATIHIVDSGIGIPQDDLPHVFERFYRAQNAQSHSGSGLGLAIARGVILLHGGTIDITSDTRGTHVVARIPLS